MLYYLIFINIIGVIIMRVDKSASKTRGMRRVPERTLWAISLLGGSIGTTVGMQLFRHKTKHLQFKFGLPLLVILQIVGFFYVYNLLT